MLCFWDFVLHCSRGIGRHTGVCIKAKKMNEEILHAVTTFEIVELYDHRAVIVILNNIFHACISQPYPKLTNPIYYPIYRSMHTTPHFQLSFSSKLFQL